MTIKWCHINIITFSHTMESNSNIMSLSQRVYSQVIRFLDFGDSLVLRCFHHAGVVAIVKYVLGWQLCKHRGHSTRIWKPLESAQRSSSRTGRGTRANSRVNKLARPAILLHPCTPGLKIPTKCITAHHVSSF